MLRLVRFFLSFSFLHKASWMELEFMLILVYTIVQMSDVWRRESFISSLPFTLLDLCGWIAGFVAAGGATASK